MQHRKPRVSYAMVAERLGRGLKPRLQSLSNLCATYSLYQMTP